MKAPCVWVPFSAPLPQIPPAPTPIAAAVQEAARAEQAPEPLEIPVTEEPIALVRRIDEPLTAAVSIMLALDNQAAQSGTVSVDWNDGTARHASDNGSGALAGDATGPVSYALSTIEVRPNLLPASAVAFAVGYSHGDPETNAFVSRCVFHICSVRPTN